MIRTLNYLRKLIPILQIIYLFTWVALLTSHSQREPRGPLSNTWSLGWRFIAIVFEDVALVYLRCQKPPKPSWWCAGLSRAIPVMPRYAHVVQNIKPDLVLRWPCSLTFVLKLPVHRSDFKGVQFLVQSFRVASD